MKQLLLLFGGSLALGVLLLLTTSWTTTTGGSPPSASDHAPRTTRFDPPSFPNGAPADTTISCLDDLPAPVTLQADDGLGGTLNVMPTDSPDPATLNTCTGGVIVRTWTAMNGMGETTSVSQNITVSADNTAPTIPVDDLVDTVACDLADYPAWIDAMRTAVAQAAEAGECGEVDSVTDNAPADFTNACGSLAVTFSLTDTCGNSRNVVFTYVTLDTVPPVMSGLPAMTSDTLSCEQTAPPPPLIVVSDNCATNLTPTFTEVSSKGADGTCAAHEYTITRSWSVSDSCGNSTSFTHTLVFKDDIAPTFTVPANVTIPCGSDPTDLTLTGQVTDAMDNCSPNVNVSFSDGAPMPGDCPGETVIIRTWRARDLCENVNGQNQRITISDEQPPTFNVPGPITVNCDQSDDLTITGQPTDVMDNCDPAPTISFVDVIIPDTCPNSYTIRRNWKAVDQCGNRDSMDQLIRVADLQAPVFFAAPQDLTFSCSDTLDIAAAFSNWIADRAGAMAADNCTDTVDLVWQVFNTGTMDPPSLSSMNCGAGDSIIRVQTVDIIVADECGNQDTMSATFRVIDDEPPVISNCPEGISVATSPGSCTAMVMLPIPLIEEACTNGVDTARLSGMAPITSAAMPGQEGETPANPMTINLPVNLALPVNAQAAGALQVRLIAADAEAPGEFFYVYGEDSTLIGQTAYTPTQCSDSETTVTISADQLTQWALDGNVTFRLEPNIPANQPGRFAVNALCNPTGRVELNLNFPIKVFGDIEFAYSVDGGARTVVDPIAPVQVAMDQGSHLVTYYATDCGGLIDSCSFSVTVEDREAPMLSCPADIVEQVAADSCVKTVQLPLPLNATDNCVVFDEFDATLPLDTTQAWLVFNRDPNLNDYLAQDKVFTFNNVAANAFGNVDLRLSFRGDFNTNGAFVRVLGEDGMQLGATSVGAATCSTPGQLALTIPAATFNGWAVDGQVTFRVEPNDISVPPGVAGDGINPCNPVTADGRPDSVSYVFASLRYNRLLPTFFTEGATTVASTQLQPPLIRPQVTLNVGTTNVNYVITDQRGNPDTCSFAVTVEDKILPVARCGATTLFINPSGLQIERVDPSVIDMGSTDNCGIDSMWLTPNTFTCDQVGQTVDVRLTVRDMSGNTNFCQTIVAIAPQRPEPTANSGLCGGDTLFLFANPPPATGGVVYTYRWFGPNDNLISNARNPVIPNIDGDDEGPYRVVVQGVTGCTSEGVVFVNIENLPLTPTIQAPTSVCTEQDLVLETSLVPTGNNVRFHWYRGLPPGGQLLETTTVPNYTVAAPHLLGQQRYYLQVEANGCISQSSTSIIVEAVQRPVASVLFRDTLVCAGETINLGAAPVNGVNYRWRGPNSYDRTQQFSALGPLAAVNEGYYYLTVSRGACESLPDSVLVNIKPLPAKPAISNNGPICAGQTLTLATTATGASAYHWIAPDQSETTTTTPAFSLPAATANQAGAWRLYITRNGCDSPLSESSIVAINPVPTASAQAMDNPVCEGRNLVLQGFSTITGASFRWTGPNGYTSNVQTPVINAVTLGRAGIYELVTRTPAGCTDTASVEVEVREGVRITGISDNASACITGQFELILTPTVFPVDNDEYTYRWRGPNGLASSSDILRVPNATPANAGSYTLEVLTAEGCVSEQRTHTVALNFAPAQPAIPTDVTNRTSFCTGEKLMLITTDYGISNVTYYWTTPGQNVVTTTRNILEVNDLDAGDSGNYTVYVVRSGCSSSPSPPRPIVVNAIPQLSVQTNSPVCEGDAVSLSATFLSNAQYNWSGPGAFTSSVNNPLRTNARIGTHDGIYRVFAIRNGCISDTVSVEVKVKPRPAPPTLNNDGPLCISNQDAVLTLGIDSASAVAGARYLWYTNGGATTLGASTNSLVFELTNFSNFSSGGTFNFFARTDLDGCVSSLSEPEPVTLNIIPANTAFAGADTTVCTGNYRLRAQPPTAGSGRWTIVNSSGSETPIIANPDQANSFVSGLSVAGAPYTLRWTLSNGACADYSFDDVVIGVTAGEPADAGDDILACLDETIVLTATPVSGMGSTGRWSQGMAQDILGVRIQTPANPTTVVTGLKPDNIYSFTWTVTSVCGTQTDVVLVNVSDPNPRAGDDLIVCNTEARTSLSASLPTVGSRGRWSSPDEELVIANVNEAQTTVSGLKLGANLLIWTIDEGFCGESASDTISVFYKLPAIPTPDVVAVPFGEATTFNPLSNDQTPADATIALTGPPERGLLQTTPEGDLLYQPPANFVGTDRVNYLIVSPGCPEITGEITFIVGEGAVCKAPSIITPNNDGINDNFVVPCLLDLDRFPASQVIIFNRWGDEVFRSNVPYQNDWYGTYDGEDLPVDTYFYVVDFGDGSEPLSGYVLIQR